MMLSMNNDGSDYGIWEGGSYLNDDYFNDLHDHDDTDDDDDDAGEYDGTDAGDVDAFDFHDHSEDGEDDSDVSVELDPADFSSDEAYARSLQDAEEREVAARLLSLAGINDSEC